MQGHTRKGKKEREEKRKSGVISSVLRLFSVRLHKPKPPTHINHVNAREQGAKTYWKEEEHVAGTLEKQLSFKKILKKSTKTQDKAGNLAMSHNW